MTLKCGVFLARMQPVHNAHLWMINKALEENDKVLIVLGSENKMNTLRNPFNIYLREKMLRESLSKKQNHKLQIMTLPDWSMEDDKNNNKIWGRYFYYNVVANLGHKRFSLYYSDNITILDDWFDDTEVSEYITYRTFDRNNLFDGLSATKLRQAFINGDSQYIYKYCPRAVYKRFNHLANLMSKVKQNPLNDFSIE